jgi:hypothetical protein
MPNPFEAGRSAPPETLAVELPTAPAGFLEGALANPALGPQHLLLVLKNPAAPASIILKIGRNPAWLKPYEVKAALVLHPKTPRIIAMNLLTHLWWRDLANAADRPGLAPSLRRAAERILSVRLTELALGEKVTLARIAGRVVIDALRRDESPMVIRALLQNPRLVEDDALAIAADRRTTGPALRVLAEDPRFSPRPAVMKAVARNPKTPAQTALRLLQHLGSRDLRDLVRMPKVPGLVKVAAQRILEARKAPDRAGRREPA